MTTPPDPQGLLRSKSYLRLLLLAALLGVPISAAAYGFLALVSYLQKELFTHLPNGLGFHGEPVWWPLPMLVMAGLVVAPVIRRLPGSGGHSPADGFKSHGAPSAAELPGVLLAALGTLVFGVVLGPEAPLIALGGGLAVLAGQQIARGPMVAQARAVVGSAGSLAAIGTLFGSPLPGAFMLMEASGLGGPLLGVVLLPGLLAAGVGALIFVGMDAWTGLGTFSLSIPGLPHFGRPDFAEFGWALVIGVAAPIVGLAIRRLAITARPFADRRLPVLLPVAGAIIAGLAIAYTEGTGKPSSDVLFSGQSGLTPLVGHAASYSAGALALLIACKGLGYGISMSGFRGGPVFPAIYLGAAGGMLMSHLPGLPLVAGIAMGIGAMSVVMLELPLTSVMLATLLVLTDGLAVMPLIIVAVVVAYVVSARLTPRQAADSGSGKAEGEPAPATAVKPAAADLPHGFIGGLPVAVMGYASGRGSPDTIPVLLRERAWRHIHLPHPVAVRCHQRGPGHRDTREGDDSADANQDGTADELLRVDLKLGLCHLAVSHL